MRKRRGNSRFFIIFISVLSGVFLLYQLLIYLNSNLNILPVKEITVSGNSTILTASLLAAADSLHYKNLYSLPKVEILRCFQSFPRIARIVISRKFPDELHLKITERIPVFNVKTVDGYIFPVDENALAISPPEDGRKEDMPFISLKLPADSIYIGNVISDEFLGTMLQKRKDIIQLEPDFFDYFSEIYLENDKPVFIETDQGYRVVFAFTELDLAAQEYMKLKDTFSFDSNTLIDMQQDGLYRITKMEKK
ncbi:MAG: FtsQ-type POTRA domain-containing protein [Candidatus Cloacimonetes bacterium]|nr:FtsQ-type POTRA domain-containing protein [Candidatus Cloacimonadota bacterium]